MKDKEFIITHLENRINILQNNLDDVVRKGQMKKTYWFTSGIISGLEEALRLIRDK